MSEAARDLAMARFRMIQPYLEERRSLELVAAEANLSFRTAQRWVSQYRKRGLAAFVRKARDDRGGRRVASQKIKEAIEGVALERPPLPIRSISRQVRAFAQSTGESMPAYGTVYDLVREVPNGLLTVAHQGSKAYSESYDLVHRREATRSNAIWQADHAQLDIKLLKQDGSTARPCLMIVIDDYNRANRTLTGSSHLLSAGRKEHLLPACQNRLNSSTSCSCTRYVPGRFSEMESISKDCAICHSRWLLTSERMRRFASTQEIWAKFARSIKTASCAEQSPLSWLERSSRCKMSFAFAINAERNCGRSSTTARRWSTLFCN